MALLGITFAGAYTQEDWRVYEGCKDRVYDDKVNDFDYESCKEMIDHKEALHKYGASSSYTYWVKRLKTI